MVEGGLKGKYLNRIGEIYWTFHFGVENLFLFPYPPYWAVTAFQPFPFSFVCSIK